MLVPLPLRPRNHPLQSLPRQGSKPKPRITVLPGRSRVTVGQDSTLTVQPSPIPAGASPAQSFSLPQPDPSTLASTAPATSTTTTAAAGTAQAAGSRHLRSLDYSKWNALELSDEEEEDTAEEERRRIRAEEDAEMEEHYRQRVRAEEEAKAKAKAEAVAGGMTAAGKFGEGGAVDGGKRTVNAVTTLTAKLTANGGEGCVKGEVRMRALGELCVHWYIICL